MTDRALQQGQQNIRIPVYQEDTDRAQNSGLGAFGSDQMLVNCIATLAKDNITYPPQQEFYIQKRPGIRYTTLDFSPSTVNAVSARDNMTMTTLQDVNVFACFDAVANKHYIIQYRPAAGTTTKVGEIAGANVNDWVFITELSIGGTPYLGLIWTKYDKSASKGYYAASGGGVFAAASLTEITGAVDADFPTNTPAKIVIGPFVQMNQTTYIMTTDGGIYNSDLNSITSWNGLGNTASQAYPDKGIGLCRYKNHVVAFGEDSIEFFNDVSNPPPGTPLQRTESAFIKFGCADPKLFINVDDQLYWVAASNKATDGLWKLEGYTPTKISSPKKDMIISTAFLNSAGHVFLRSIAINGTNNIIITLGTYGTLDNVMNYDYFPLDSDDPCPSTTQSGTPGSRSAMLCYCIDSGTCWFASDMSIYGGGGGSGVYWLPTGYYPVQGGALQNKYLQFVVKGNPSFSGYQNAIFSIEGTDTYQYFYDSTINGGNRSGTFANAVRATIQMNPFEFQNLKNKVINRIEVVMDMLDTSALTSKLYLVLKKNDFTTIANLQSIKRALMLPTPMGRYYFNNFGHMRRGVIALSNCSDGPWRVKAVELTVTQKTN